MILDLMNYQTSILNPGLKIIVPLLFIVGIYYLYSSRIHYSGLMLRLLYVFIVIGFLGFLANGFRFVGDFLSIEFKWGESLFFFIFALFSILLSFNLLKIFDEAKGVLKQ